MPELRFSLVDSASFDAIPLPARPGARCQTCDYWERLDGGREAADPGDPAAERALAAGKRGRLLAGRELAGAYGMLASRIESVERRAIGWCQFGPLSAYPRAQVIRDRYPQLPESPAPWVVTCLQISAEAGDPEARRDAAAALLGAVCDDLDRRGITAVEAYPERAADPWEPSPGPAQASSRSARTGYGSLSRLTRAVPTFHDAGNHAASSRPRVTQASRRGSRLTASATRSMAAGKPGRA